ncbi:MAG: hypothetical protein Q4F43_02425 [Eubacteriales bacterium]|nr:hypothetical protein [Eubacteriales bacterium]
MRQEAVTVSEGNLEAALTRQYISATSMSFSRVVSMLILIAAMTAALIGYIKLQTDVTASSQEIASLEKQLSEMKAENDAAYNEISDSISLEEVRDKAINELGMKYADRDQVVVYTGSENESVHQVTEIEGR